MAFNSNQYAWVDIQVVMLGRPIAGLTSFKYKVSRTKTNIYAKGDKPFARTRGNKEYEGEIGILQSELEAIQEGLPKGQDITDIPPFDIIYSYAPVLGGKITTDIAKGVEFTELEKGMGQNAPNMELVLPIIMGDVEYSV